jgi:hypothetical protein
MRANKLTFPLLALLFGTFLLPGPAAGANGNYVDKQYGFTIRIGPDWSQTPTQPGEKIEVGKWKDDQKGDFATLTICRFAKVAAETTPGRDGIPELPTGWGPPQPKSAFDYLKYEVQGRAEQMVARGMKEVIPEIPEPKTVKMGKIEGKIYQAEWESQAWRGQGQAWVAGIVGNDTEEYLILYASPLNRVKKLTPWFVQSIRSFRLAGDVTPDSGEEDDGSKRGTVLDKSDELLDLPKRERIKKELVGTWRFIDTPHYLVIYNCDDKLANYIARRCEYMRTNAYEKVFPPVAPIMSCMVVRVCKEMDEYYHYGAPRGSAGYWSSGTDELVFPDLSQSKKPDITTIGVMHHEAFHQYIHYALLENHPPIWFNEGFAEYFFCVEFKSWGERLSFEKRHPMRYATVKSEAGSGGLVPLKDLIKMSQGQYYSRAQLCYSEGWAFATWLMNVTKNERYRQIPRIMFEEMQKRFAAASQPGPDGQRDPTAFFGGGEKILEDATEKAFEGIDLDKLHEEFVEDIKRKM